MRGCVRVGRGGWRVDYWGGVVVAVWVGVGFGCSSMFVVVYSEGNIVIVEFFWINTDYME